MKLFAFYIGGATATSNIEVHDMRFVVAEQMEDCFSSLRQQWWGKPETLHLDCWMELASADEHRVSLRPGPAPAGQKLFFVNLGGYDPAQFTELHKNVFVVAEDAAAAKKRACALVKDWMKPHRDKLFEVEHIVGLSDLARDAGLHLHLEPAHGLAAPPFVTGLYTLLNR